MKYSTVYVGMDVHKESFSLCCYTNEKEQAEYPQKVDAHYSKVINSITGTIPYSYAVMRLDASVSRYTTN